MGQPLKISAILRNSGAEGTGLFVAVVDDDVNAWLPGASSVGGVSVTAGQPQTLSLRWVPKEVRTYHISVRAYDAGGKQLASTTLSALTVTEHQDQAGGPPPFSPAQSR